MAKGTPLTDLNLDQDQRTRLFQLIGEIREFAPLLAKARNKDLPATPEIESARADAARKHLERLRDRGIFNVKSQRDLAKALEMKPSALVARLLGIPQRGPGKREQTPVPHQPGQSSAAAGSVHASGDIIDSFITTGHGNVLTLPAQPARPSPSRAKTPRKKQP